jgi:hypothetical protein
MCESSFRENRGHSDPIDLNPHGDRRLLDGSVL